MSLPPNFRSAGLERDYVAALTGYAASVLARKLRRATSGCTLQPCLDKRSDSNYVKVSDVFGANESSIGFSYDYFEVGLGEGAGSWATIAADTVNALRRQASRAPGRPAELQRGSATAIPRRADSFDAVVTDPPYDSMIDYSDASDLFYVWVKRALSSTHPELLVTADPLRPAGQRRRDHRQEGKPCRGPPDPGALRPADGRGAGRGSPCRAA